MSVLRPFLLYYVTDRRAFGGDRATQIASLCRLIGQLVASGVDFVQIREKDLATRDLLALVERVVAMARGTATKILVNDRLDVALSTGAAGVHLGGQSTPPRRVRRIVAGEFLVGVSCHSLEEAFAAEAAGADYVLLGHIFDTPSKREYGSPLGLEKLREVVVSVRTPVLALGGITLKCAASCRETGAAGIAGISLFQSAEFAEARVRQIRRSAGL